jgi:chromosome segregation ATPase
MRVTTKNLPKRDVKLHGFFGVKVCSQAILLSLWLAPALAETPSAAAALDERLTQLEADLRVERDRAADAVARSAQLQEELDALQARLEASESAAAQQAAGLAEARAALADWETQIGQQGEAFEAAKQSAAATEARLQAQIAELKKVADQQAGELDTLGVARLQLSQDLKHVRATVAEITQERDELTQALVASQQQTAADEARLASLQQELRAAEETLTMAQQERDQARQDSADARESNRELLAVRAQLERRLVELEAATSGLRDSLAGLQSAVPAALGGTATREALQARARRHADALRLAYRAWRADRQNEDLLARLKKAEKDLYASQLQVAGMYAEGLGVHRLLPRETLSAVAQAEYGNLLRWQKIYAANAHILDDPNKVLPGMTVVIP